MSYRESLRPASFRGVPFEVENSKLTGGRRIVVHEFAQRDRPYVEDLGLAPRKFPLVAFVLEPNYLEKRDRLLAALEQGGPGTLIHPFYGAIEVAVESWSAEEGTKNGGMAELTIQFVLAGELEFPTQNADTNAQAANLGQAAREQIATDFSERFSLVGQPDFVRESAKSEFQRSLDAMRTTIGG